MVCRWQVPIWIRSECCILACCTHASIPSHMDAYIEHANASLDGSSGAVSRPLKSRAILLAFPEPSHARDNDLPMLQV